MLRVYALLAALLLAWPARGQVPDDQALAGFDVFVAQTLKDYNTPGVAIAVVRDGKPVLVRGYGVRDPATNAPMTADTRFPIASMTKAFTAFTVGLLVDDGKMSFDTPVGAYLPGFQMHDGAATAQVTLRDMLSHRTGLPRHDAIWYHNDELGRSDFLARLPHLESSAPLRSKFQYNNWMFTLSGLAVERVSGQPWERFTEARVFQPLAMSRTTFDGEAVTRDADHTKGTVVSEGKRLTLPLYAGAVDTLNPAGGIYSTAADLSRWLAVNTGGGSYNGRAVIQPATLAVTHTLQMPTGATPDHPANLPVGYGLGWFNDVYRGTPLVQHGGNLPGISTRQTVVPSKGLGVVVLVNQNGSELPALLTRTLLDRFSGAEPIDWVGEGLKRKRAREANDVSGRANKEATRVKGTRPSHALAAYAGAYEHPGYGRTTIRHEGGRLVGAYNRDSSPLAHWHYDSFDATVGDPENLWRDQRVQFRTDTRGRIDALLVAIEPQIAPVVFRKTPDARLSDPAYLSTLAGTYELNANPVQVSVSGTKLIYTPRGAQPAEMIPSLDGEFIHPRATNQSIRFVQDASGRVTGYQIINSSGLYEAKRIR